MKETTGNRWLAKLTCPILFGILLLCAPGPVQAFAVGETYDASNWSEIQEFGPPALINWVKKGEFIIQTKKVDYEWKIMDPEFLEATRENESKFKINEEGFTVDKKTGKRPVFLYGLPFPTIDPNDPTAGTQIIENFQWMHYRCSAFRATGQIAWVGTGGKEREVIAGGDYFFYQGRAQGPVSKNSMNFLSQQMIYVLEPFDLRGTVQMLWIYDENKADSSFAYLPMLRRVRRVSAASRSDPFLGSDLCTDDGYGWTGKNQSMEWRFLGEGKVLALITNDEKIYITEDDNGALHIKRQEINIGYEVPGWQGAPWAPVDAVWIPRDVWIVEAIPKDSLYNYGRMRYYVDKDGYDIWYKEINDRADLYWKTVVLVNHYEETQTGQNMVGRSSDYYIIVDDKTHHSTVVRILDYPGVEGRLNLPEGILGPDDFTVGRMMQLSK